MDARVGRINPAPTNGRASRGDDGKSSACEVMAAILIDDYTTNASVENIGTFIVTLTLKTLAHTVYTLLIWDCQAR